MTRVTGVTEDELRDQCDHVCLKGSDHVERGEPHFYGYRGGPWSLDWMQGQIDELRASVRRLRIENMWLRRNRNEAQALLDRNPLDESHTWTDLADDLGVIPDTTSAASSKRDVQEPSDD